MEPSRKAPHPTIFLIISINITPVNVNFKSTLELSLILKITEIHEAKNIITSDNT
jgi:hypothetical protein